MSTLCKTVAIVADQVYGDEDMHGVVRQLCVDYMVILLHCSLTTGITDFVDPRLLIA